MGYHCLLHINIYSLWYNGERGEIWNKRPQEYFRRQCLNTDPSHCCQWVWGLGQLIPELLQTCHIYSAASSLFPLQSLLPKHFSPSVTDHSFPDSSQWLQDKFHPPQWDIQGALLSGFSWLSKDPIAAKWIYSLSSDSPETASLDLWRLIWYPGAEWCPWTPLSLWLFPGNSTIHQLLCSGCFTVLLLHKPGHNVISLRYCSLLQSMSKHIIVYYCLSHCAPVLQTHLSR